MAEKIVIAEFDIEGVSELIKETGDLIATQERLKKQNRDLKKDTDGLSKATDDQKSKFVQNQIQIKKLSQEVNSNKKLTASLTGVTKDLTNEINREVVSVSQARAQNSKLLKLRNDLNLKTKEGQAAAKQINQVVDENTKFIKSNVSENEKRILGIGEYTKGIKNAFVETGGFNVVLGTLQQTFRTLGPLTKAFRSDLSNIAEGYREGKVNTENMTKAQRIQATAVNLSSAAFRVLKLAIAATGVGLLLIALGSLVTFLAKTQRGIDLVTTVTRPLQAVFSALIGVAQKLGETIFDTFSNPKQALVSLADLIKNNLINRFKALGIVLDGILNFDVGKIKEGALQAATGVQDISGKISEASKNTRNFLAEAAAKGTQIDNLTKSIEQSEAEIVLTRAKSLQQIKELELTAKNTSLSAAERNKAGEAALEISRGLSQAEREILDLKIKREEIEQTLNDSGREDLKRLNELKAEQVAATEAENARELKFISTKKALQTEQAQAAKKVIDQSIKDNEVRLQLFIEESQGQAKSLEDRLAFEKSVYDQSLANLNQKLEAEKATEEQKELAVLELKNEFLKKQTDLTIDYANQELDLYLQQNQSRIEQGELLTQALVDQEIDRINKIQEAEAGILEAKREANLISELEFLTVRAQQEDEFNEQRAALKNAKADQDVEIQNQREDLAFEQKLIRLSEQDNTELEIALEKAERDKETEIAKTEQQYIDEETRQLAIQNIEERYRIQKEGAEIADVKRQEISRQQQLAAYGGFFDAISGLLGKSSDSGKAFAMAATTIDTYLAAQKAYTSQLAIPTPDAPVRAGVAAGVAIAQGLARVAKIATVKPQKAERGLEVSAGGLLAGNRHSAGGILIEAEDGEMIMNRKATSMFLPELRAMQLAGRGNSGVIRNSFAADGGQVARQLSGRSQSIRDTQKLIETSTRAIRVYNVAADTVDVANEGIIVENQANL